MINESGNGLSNERGTVGMARTQDPHGSDAQFYVNLYDNAALDPNKTRWGYAVFGNVISGMDVVDRIGDVPPARTARSRKTPAQTGRDPEDRARCRLERRQRSKP